MKILNLNLWNYNDFDKRKSKIIKFIQKHNPDIVTFQEVRDDLRFNSKGNNQAKQLNKILGFKHCVFRKTMDVNQVNKTPKNPDCFEGIAVLSNIPVLEVKKKKLKQHPDDKYTRGILSIKIEDNNLKNILVVHYSQDDLFSKLHLEETLSYAKRLNINPLIIGDFNIRDPKIIYNLIDKEYVCSRQIKKYISYPPAKYSLDYFLIPKKIKLKSFSCLGLNISDHKALLLEI